MADLPEAATPEIYDRTLAAFALKNLLT